MRRLLLISNSTQHGSGFLEHCAGQLQDFLGEDLRRVLFVPYALADHDAYTDKAVGGFGRIGLEVDGIHRAADPVAAVAEAEAMFIGGGNTFRLLNTLYGLGLVPAIRAAVARGMPYTGASAGSNVACWSIKTTNDMPIVYPPSFDALQLVPFQLNPHYIDPDPGSTHMGETRETRIREFHEENAEPVIGIREGSMLRVEGDRMQLLGPRGGRLFVRGEDPAELAPGADLSAWL